MRKQPSIVILTGAGISAESGIRTFRDSHGLWENHRVEDVASPEGFARDPRLVLDFYNQRRRQVLSGDVQENPAHIALGQLERDFHGDLLVVTQNIDDLHERGGSRRLIHMHGEILKKRCVSCDHVSEVRGDITINDVCECCEQPGRLRPHIVWFGEMPLEMDRIFEALSSCNLFVSIGTSGNVHPAAGFVQIANQAGAKTVELNLEPGVHGSCFQRCEYGKATELVPVLVEQLLGKR